MNKFQTRKFQLPLSLAFIISLMGPAQAVETIGREALLIDMTTGAVLLEKSADTPMPPASMSKLMTIYMVFSRLKEGSLSLEDTFSVSENAWRKGGAKSGSSTMFLEPGKRITVEDLLRGVIVQSGNDACIVLAEGLAGSEAAFALEMTAMGRELGLGNSTFKNSTGWPDPDHMMTARDIGVLSQRIIKDFPEFYPIFSETEYTFNGIRQINRNPLLYKNMGADGLKTGHTKDAGYGLAASVKRGERRLLLVINGLKSKRDRSREPERLIEWGFREYNNYALFNKGDTVTQANVWLGVAATVPLVIQDDLLLTIRRKNRKGMVVKVVYNGPIAAPISAGTPLATLHVTIPNMDPIELPLTAGVDVAQLGLTGRLSAAFRQIIWGESR